jgi:pilus assembly protein Flp/PilA
MCCVIRKVLILPGKLVADQLIEMWKYYSGVTGGATDTPATASTADDDNRWHSQIPSLYFYFQEQVMTKFISAIKKFANDEQGITAIEYCLLAAVLSTVVLGAFPTLETSLKAFFTALGTKLNNSLSDA